MILASFVNKILGSYNHESFSAHQGARNTFRKLKNPFFWDNLKGPLEFIITSLAKFIKGGGARWCSIPLQHMTPIANEFEWISMDIIGLLPVSCTGMKYLLVDIYHLTRIVVVVPLENQKAEMVAKVFAESHFAIWSTNPFSH